MKTTMITSSAQATLLLFGAVVVAVVIFMADTRTNAAPAPVNQEEDLDKIAQSIQTNLSAAGVAGQLANLRSQLPPFDPGVGPATPNGLEFQPTAAIPTPIPPAPTVELVPLPTPTPVVVMMVAPTPQVVERVIYVEVTAVPPPQPVYQPPPVYQPQQPQVQTIGYQPVQGGTTPDTWVTYQIGHKGNGTYIFTAGRLWMQCPAMYLVNGGSAARTNEGGQVATWFNSQPAQEQLAYYHICDYALKQEGKR